MNLGEELRKEPVFRGGFHLREQSKDFQDGCAHGQPAGYRLFSERLSPHQLLKRNRQGWLQNKRVPVQNENMGPFSKMQDKGLAKVIGIYTFPCLGSLAFSISHDIFICCLMLNFLRQVDAHQVRTDSQRHLRSCSATCQVLKQDPPLVINT